MRGPDPRLQLQVAAAGTAGGHGTWRQAEKCLPFVLILNSVLILEWFLVFGNDFVFPSTDD